MEIEDVLHTLAPGECIKVEKIASDVGLPVEEVEQKLKSMVRADPDLELIVNTQGTYLQIKRGKKDIKQPPPTEPTEDKKKIAYCYMVVSGIAFFVGGFINAPSGFSVVNGLLGLVVAFFVTLFFFECYKY